MDVGAGTFLENGTDLVEVVHVDDEGVLLCQDASLPEGVEGEPKKIPPRLVVPPGQERRGVQWRVVPLDRQEAA